MDSAIIVMQAVPITMLLIAIISILMEMAFVIIAMPIMQIITMQDVPILMQIEMDSVITVI